MATHRELSRQDWNGTNNVADINSGSLQRIADATEKMAGNYIQMQNDRDLYKRWYEEGQAERDRLYRRIAALRGAVTKAKRRAGRTS